MFTNRIHKNQTGFTIVEVMIVLAIAGLILAIVFIAVPALQRNSRNTGRRADLGNLRAQLETWTSNNGGKIPADADIDHLKSIVQSTGWGHYNGNKPIPGNIILGTTTTTGTCAQVTGEPALTATALTSLANCESDPDTNGTDNGVWTPSSNGQTKEYEIGYVRDFAVSTLELPNRNEIHIFGEMACGAEILSDGNDDDGTGTSPYDANDVQASNARAIAYVYQIEGEDNARCEDNV